MCVVITCISVPLSCLVQSVVYVFLSFYTQVHKVKKGHKSKFFKLFFAPECNMKLNLLKKKQKKKTLTTTVDITTKHRIKETN